jgi:hypothetical protein
VTRGLPPIDERTLIAAYERVLARVPDDIGQADEAGEVTFASCGCARTRAP